MTLLGAYHECAGYKNNDATGFARGLGVECGDPVGDFLEGKTLGPVSICNFRLLTSQVSDQVNELGDVQRASR